MSQPWTIYESPLGPLTLVGGPGGLRALYSRAAADRLMNAIATTVTSTTSPTS
jgi:hypothetical protein